MPCCPRFGITPVVQTHMRLPWLAAEDVDPFLGRFDANAATENLRGSRLWSGTDLAGVFKFLTTPTIAQLPSSMSGPHLPPSMRRP